MLRTIRDWWPFLSGFGVALFAAAAKFSANQSQIFLVARMFRFELLALFIALTIWGLVKFFVADDSPWHPATLLREGKLAIREGFERRVNPVNRIAGLGLAAAIAAFLVMFAFYLQGTAAFFGERYNHADRQAMLNEAVEAEDAERLPAALALYGAVIERFPLDMNNELTQNKIDQIRYRYEHWRAAAARFHAIAGPGMASTKYDRIVETCRYVTKIDPCLQVEAYLGPVEDAIERAGAERARCVDVVAKTENGSEWIFIDPIDRKWLEIDQSDAYGLCRTLGLESGTSLAEFLRSRWQPDLVRHWMNPSSPYYAPTDDLIEN